MAANKGSASIEELVATAESRPFMSAAPLPDGYVEREFTFGGTATLHELDDPETWSIAAQEQRAYRTRFMVRYPTDPSRFNGVVVVEWLNITAMFDLDAEWLIHSGAMAADGCAYVAVTTHEAGISHLQNWNAERYAGLHIDDDGLSYGIFSDVARLVREQSRSLLGGLEATHLVGVGASQSAWRLVSYVDFFHARDRVFDGYLLRGRGFGGTPIHGMGMINGPQPAPIRLDLDVPVMIVQNEGDLLGLKYIFEQQEESPLVRVWELAGAAHGSLESMDTIAERAATNGIAMPESLIGRSETLLNVMRIDAVSAMAYHHMARWITGGEAPPPAPRLERAADLGPLPTPETFGEVDPALLARDEHGNTRGGIRLPDIDAPVGQLLGSTTGSLLSGEFVPFSLETLARLYPTHERYVDAVRASALRAEAAGWIDAAAAKAYVDDAEASDVPNALPAYAIVGQ